MFEQSFLKEAISKGLLTQEQLDSSREKARLQNKPLLDSLIEDKVVVEAEIMKIVAAKLDKSFVDKIYDNMIDPVLLGRVPFKFLRQNSLMLILHQGKNLALLASPKYLNALDDLHILFGTNIDYGFADRAVLIDALNRYYPFNVGQDAIDELTDDGEDFDLDQIKEQDIVDNANDAPIVKLVNHIIFQAIKEGASDIHIEPFEKELRVRFRIDGIMHYKFSPPKRHHGAIISRIKIMSNLNIAEKRLPQGGRIQIKVTDKSIDLRISILPCNYGERVVMRILDKSKGAVALEDLPLSPRDFKVIEKTIQRPNGIILVSGPTGSGKTTTLYSILTKLNDSDSNIITVEDPVEYTINGVNQVQVNVKSGLTFAFALREILRQDPDIALIGEIRDGETAGIATQAALTGHLVLSTIHTNSAPATINRLIDMGVESYLIASSLICVIAQRLVRGLCQTCKESYSPSQELLERFNINNTIGSDVKFFKAIGCQECFNTGYKGRIPLFEVMEVKDEIASLIVKKANALEIRKQAVSDGMTTLSDDGLRKATKGLTTLEEVFSVAFVDS